MRALLLGTAIFLTHTSPMLAADWYILRTPATRACTIAEAQAGVSYEGELLTKHPTQSAAAAHVKDLESNGACTRPAASNDAASPGLHVKSEKPAD
jgi:hypothetical protein